MNIADLKAQAKHAIKNKGKGRETVYRSKLEATDTLLILHKDEVAYLEDILCSRLEDFVENSSNHSRSDIKKCLALLSHIQSDETDNPMS